MSNVQNALSVAFLVATATLVSSAAFAKDDANSCPSVTRVQRKIVEHADQGMESLRSYVWLTSRVYGIDMLEVKESLDNWRAAVACQEQAAQDAAKLDVASKAVNEGDR